MEAKSVFCVSMQQLLFDAFLLLLNRGLGILTNSFNISFSLFLCFIQWVSGINTY